MLDRSAIQVGEGGHFMSPLRLSIDVRVLSCHPCTFHGKQIGSSRVPRDVLVVKAGFKPRSPSCASEASWCSCRAALVAQEESLRALVLLVSGMEIGQALVWFRNNMNL